MTVQVTPQTLSFVQNLEGFTPKAQWDGTQYSYGYGTKAPGPGATIDQASAVRALQNELSQAASYVNSIAPNASLAPNVADALISAAFNLGSFQPGLVSAVQSGNPQAIASHLAQYTGTYVPGTSVGVDSRRNQEVQTVLGNPTPAYSSQQPTQVASAAPRPNLAPQDYAAPSAIWAGMTPNAQGVLTASASPTPGLGPRTPSFDWASLPPQQSPVAQTVVDQLPIAAPAAPTTFDVPPGPFGADALVQAVLSDDPAALQKAVTTTLWGVAYAGPSGPDQLHNYLTGLIQDNPALGQAVQSKFASDPSLIQTIPEDFFGHPVRSVIQSALTAPTPPAAPTIPPGGVPTTADVLGSGAKYSVEMPRPSPLDRPPDGHQTDSLFDITRPGGSTAADLSVNPTVAPWSYGWSTGSPPSAGTETIVPWNYPFSLGPPAGGADAFSMPGSPPTAMPAEVAPTQLTSQQAADATGALGRLGAQAWDPWFGPQAVANAIADPSLATAQPSTYQPSSTQAAADANSTPDYSIAEAPNPTVMPWNYAWSTGVATPPASAYDPFAGQQIASPSYFNYPQPPGYQTGSYAAATGNASPAVQQAFKIANASLGLGAPLSSSTFLPKTAQAPNFGLPNFYNLPKNVGFTSSKLAAEPGPAPEPVAQPAVPPPPPPPPAFVDPYGQGFTPAEAALASANSYPVDANGNFVSNDSTWMNADQYLPDTGGDAYATSRF